MNFVLFMDFLTFVLLLPFSSFSPNAEARKTIYSGIYTPLVHLAACYVRLVSALSLPSHTTGL